MRDAVTNKTPIGKTYQGKPRTHGFRFSLIDGVAIVACGVATALLWPAVDMFSLLLPYVLGHFFLFCNIFRIRRQPELIWAALFVVNMIICLLWLQLAFVIPLLAQLPITATLIALEIRKATYHGIFAQHWNRQHLAAYLRGDVS